MHTINILIKPKTKQKLSLLLLNLMRAYECMHVCVSFKHQFYIPDYYTSAGKFKNVMKLV